MKTRFGRGNRRGASGEGCCAISQQILDNLENKYNSIIAAVSKWRFCNFRPETIIVGAPNTISIDI